jgi:DNA-binding beta-propeller fold protein YncE
VGDKKNNRVRLIDVATGAVTTLAGSGSDAFADGTGSAASFNFPAGLAYSPDGSTIAVADRYNHRVRLVDVATGAVTTLAGSGNQAFGDGTGSAASFSSPSGLAYSADGSTIAVVDYENNRVREICTGITAPTAAPTDSPTEVEPDESSGSTALTIGVVGALVVVAGLAGFAAVKRKSMVSNPHSHRTVDDANAQYGVGIEVKPTRIL